MRQLVTIRTVKELVEIANADRIELAKIDGWQCVVKKGEFKIGDKALYFEIDSILPDDDERFAFLEQHKFRIKTTRFRGSLSQGLLMPLSILTAEEEWRIRRGDTPVDVLRVQKYEPPVPIQGKQKGNFPNFVRKTDQERIQNIPEILTNGHFTSRKWEITEKLDGSSVSFFHYNDQYISVPQTGACSRNWEMELNDDNVYAKLFKQYDLGDKLLRLSKNIAIQGEMIGPKIQGNKYKRGQQEFYVFDIFDIDEQRYLNPDERWKITEKLELNHVPLIQHCTTFLSITLDELLSMAENKSQLYDTQREGVVFKSWAQENGLKSFKVISNKFLLKNE